MIETDRLFSAAIDTLDAGQAFKRPRTFGINPGSAT